MADLVINGFDLTIEDKENLRATVENLRKRIYEGYELTLEDQRLIIQNCQAVRQERFTLEKLKETKPKKTSNEEIDFPEIGTKVKKEKKMSKKAMLKRIDELALKNVMEEGLTEEEKEELLTLSVVYSQQ